MFATAVKPSIASAAPTDRRALALLFAERLSPIAAGLVALIVGLARPTNTDISWLLTVNNRILEGATPYKDVVELNPPASILLYRLPAAAAHWFPLRAETATVIMAALAIAAVLAFLSRSFARYELGDVAHRFVFLLVATAVLSILPFDEMAQREHFATIFALPYAATAMVRAAGKKPALAEAVFSGVLMGLCVAIKPHFALCAFLVATLAAWRERTVRAYFRPEYLAICAVALVYLIVSVVFFPDFFSEVLPMVRDLYLPVRLGPAQLVGHIVPLLIAPVALCWIYRNRPRTDGAFVLLSMAAGFLAAFFLQGKGWIYHAYPAIVFAVLAAAWACREPSIASPALSRKATAFILAAAIIIPAPGFFRLNERRAPLAAAIVKIAPHPRILALSFRQSLGHPLARNVGTWVGRSWGLWATGLAALMKERVGNDATLRAKADAYAEADRLSTARDIETQRPDIVLIEETQGFDFDGWIAGSPQLAAAMANYQRVETVDGVEILQRRRDEAG